MDIRNIASPEDIEPESLDFIYKNAVSYLESIHKSMEYISNRSLVLLSYLMIVVGFTTSRVISHIVSLFLNNRSHSDWIDFSVLVLGAALVIYYISIIWSIVHYSKPRLANVAYSQPNDILNLELNSYGPHIMKFVRCIELQGDIEEDIKIMTDMFIKFEKAIDKAFIFPLVPKLIKSISYWLLVRKVKQTFCA